MMNKKTKETKVQPIETVQISQEEQRARHKRNVAMALCLGGLVVIFLGVTMFKVGENLSQMERSL